MRNLSKSTSMVALSTILLVASGCIEGTNTDSPSGLSSASLKVQGTQAAQQNSQSSQNIGGSPQVTSVMNFSDLPVVDADGTAAGTLTLTSARVVIEEISIDVQTADNQFGAVSLFGPFIADLVSGTLTPEPSQLLMATATYEAISIEFSPLDEEDAASLGMANDDPLINSTLVITGNYTGKTADGDVTNMPLELIVEEEAYLEMFADSGDAYGMALSSAKLNEIIVAFRMDDWFDLSSDINSDGVNLSQLNVENGGIYLNDDEDGKNKDFYEFLTESIHASADFGIDEDDDGYLDEHEDCDYDEYDDEEDDDEDDEEDEDE